jgi:hypothetical protein
MDLAISPGSRTLDLAEPPHIEAISPELGHENNDRCIFDRLRIFSANLRFSEFLASCGLTIEEFIHWQEIVVKQDWCAFALSPTHREIDRST